MRKLLLLSAILGACAPLPPTREEIALAATSCGFPPGTYELRARFTSGTCGFAGDGIDHVLAVSFDGAYLDATPNGITLLGLDASTCGAQMEIIAWNYSGEDFPGGEGKRTDAYYALDLQLAAHGGKGLLRMRGWLNCDELFDAVVEQVN